MFHTFVDAHWWNCALMKNAKHNQFGNVKNVVVNLDFQSLRVVSYGPKRCIYIDQWSEFERKKKYNKISGNGREFWKTFNSKQNPTLNPSFWEIINWKFYSKHEKNEKAIFWAWQFKWQGTLTNIRTLYLSKGFNSILITNTKFQWETNANDPTKTAGDFVSTRGISKNWNFFHKIRISRLIRNFFPKQNWWWKRDIV